MTREQVRQALLEVIAEILPHLAPESVTDDQSLRDLGADSVERVEIISFLLERLDRAEPLTNFRSVPDIGALIDHLTGEGDR